MLKLLYNRSIDTRFGIAYVLLLMPVAFLLWVIVGDIRASMGVARDEIAGVKAVANVTRIQDEMWRSGALSDLPTRIGTLDWSGIPSLAASVKADAIAAASSRDQTLEGADTGLLTAIARIADASGLIWDADLDSYYVMDVAR